MLDALHTRILNEAPVPADAIVWLQGNGYDRGPKVLELLSGGYAPRIIVTGNRVRSPITVDHLVAWLAEREVPAEAMRVDAASLHTRDQAVHVLALAQDHGWRTLLLVASPHHQLRAFLTFVKRAEEIGWGGRLVNQPVVGDWDAHPSERAQSARALFADELTKFGRYPAHIAAVREGLACLDAWRVVARPTT